MIEVPQDLCDTVVTLGTFDGVHRGHRKLLERTAQITRERQTKSVAFTFPYSPKYDLEGREPELILPVWAKVKAIQGCGIDYILLTEFQTVRLMSPRMFVEDVLIGKLNAACVVVGFNHRFGRDRAGDMERLKALGREHDFDVVVVPPVIVGGQAVSSTTVRQAIRAGALDVAAELLGYYPLLFGTVVPGDQLGRTLGFPTANLKIEHGVFTPATGIYAVKASFDGEEWPAVMYIGRRPTFGHHRQSFEVHLFDPELSEDLYGVELKVKLIRRIRDDQKFPDSRSLKKQVAEDVEAVKSLFRQDLTELPDPIVPG
ncbi:MAG: riboflavin biosynthesis protein RibF [Candidatus Bipolaricaulia bacterium]